VRVGVGADGVALGDDPAHQVGMALGSLPRDEERGDHAEAGELVEDERRVHRVGPVVEGDGDPAATGGQRAPSRCAVPGGADGERTYGPAVHGVQGTAAVARTT